MRNEPREQDQAARERMDRQDAHRKAKALISRIGQRQATPQELEALEALREAGNS